MSAESDAAAMSDDKAWCPELGRRRCVRVKRDGERCKLAPVKGSTVCGKHGAGKGSPVRRAADAKVADETARRAARKWDLSEARNITPRQGLLEEWNRVCLVVDYLDGLVSDVGYDAVGEPELPGPGDKLGVEYLRALVQWRDQEISRKVKLGVDLEKLGLSERELALAEEHAKQLGSALVRALTEEQVDTETAVRVLRRLGPLLGAGA